jgi:hypothetical protein
VRNHPSSKISLKQSAKDVNETSQQFSVNALNQTRSDDHSNVAMVTVDTEADALVILQPISWRHSTTKGTAKSFIQAIPAQILPYRYVTVYRDITVSPNNHRFFAIDNRGKRSWRAFDHNTNMMKYASIPIYFMTAKCGADFK